MLSIIIPTLNEEKTIERTLKSIKELRDFDYEIIVSDGRSTDRTVEIAQKYGARVLVYDGIARQTISNGKNLGASVASGEFFVFVDADVVIPNINNFFKKALAAFAKRDNKKNKLVALAVSIRVLPELETFGDKIIFPMMNHLYFFWNNIVGLGGAGGEFQMIRASVFMDLKGYDEKIAAAEDIDMFQRLAKVGKTSLELSLKVMHTGRRAHKIGWSKLLLTWFANWITVTVLRRSVSTVWEEVR